jgi:hypothetical protein
MSKLPFLQFYPADYLVDTRVLTLTARGAWVDILCILHGSSTRGTTKFPARGWARIMGVPEADFLSALREIEDMKVGDVIRDSNGDVTLTCRRMMNESITRTQTRLRVQNHREKERNAGCNASSNADVTRNKSEVRSQKSEAKNNTAPVPVAAGEPADCPFPPEVTKKRERNPLLDAFAGCGGADPLQIPPKAWSGIGKAFADVRDVCPQITIQEIARRSANYRTHMSTDTILTPHALAKNWALCDKPNPRNKPAQETEFGDAFDPDFQPHFHRNNPTTTQ